MSDDERLDRLEAAVVELDQRVQVMLGHQGWNTRPALNALQAEAVERALEAAE